LIEEGEQFVEFLLRDRVVFMNVATGATEREAHPSGADGVDAVHDIFDAVFLVAMTPPSMVIGWLRLKPVARR